MQHIYLSRRNLLTLLSKLDRAARGELTMCSLVKCDTTHPTHPCSNECIVTAVEDDEYYAEREAGEVVDEDENAIDLGGARHN